MQILVQKIVKVYKDLYKDKPEIVVSAPGRVNIIGEHTDYTGGLVLPVAIDKEIIFAASKVKTNTIKGYSIDFNEHASCSVGDYDPKHTCSWFRYVMGVLREFEKSGFPIEGFSFAVGGNVPIGSGLSSSAALEMAVCKAMEGLFNFKLNDTLAAQLTQRAENNFVGVNCGIMDQYISRAGKINHALQIDCTDLSTQLIPVNTIGYTWFIIDSQKRRGLVDSLYNHRRKECEEGLRAAQSIFKDRTITGLRDLSLHDLHAMKKNCSETVIKRIKHILKENDRVLLTSIALKSGNVETVGKNLYASHFSLKDDFEVSCPELDTIVSLLSAIPGVAGARLTGAGFGGFVLALVNDTVIENFSEELLKKYYSTLPDSKKHLESESANIIKIKISDGARFIQ